MGTVLVIYTGGTLGMGPGPKGLLPNKDILPVLTENLKNVECDVPDWEFIAMDPVVDSANIALETWRNIAVLIAERAGLYDGFVVIHGTDTMCYTASALSFLLYGLDVTVIMTGSMRPLVEKESDAKANLIQALGAFAVPRQLKKGVYVAFSGHIYNGTRVTKYNSSADDAFASPRIFERHSEIVSERPEILNVNVLENLKSWRSARVGIMPIFPGIEEIYFGKELDASLEAMILLLYGSGTAPSGNDRFIKKLTESSEKYKIIVGVSQCFSGHVHLDIYEAGAKLVNAGVVSGADMTVEAAYAKLQYLIGMNFSDNQIKRLFLSNLCGERSF